MQTGIFLRYRSDSVVIEPNIKDRVSELIPLLEKNNDNLVSFLQNTLTIQRNQNIVL